MMSTRGCVALSEGEVEEWDKAGAQQLVHNKCAQCYNLKRRKGCYLLSLIASVGIHVLSFRP